MPETSSDDPLPTVRRVAALARLSITDDEARTLGAQFAEILAHFRVLADLDVEGVEGTTGTDPALRDVVREDVPGAAFPAGRLLEGAPRRAEGGDDGGPGFYVVPKTVGGAPKPGGGGR